MDAVVKGKNPYDSDFFPPTKYILYQLSQSNFGEARFLIQLDLKTPFKQRTIGAMQT